MMVFLSLVLFLLIIKNVTGFETSRNWTGNYLLEQMQLQLNDVTDDWMREHFQSFEGRNVKFLIVKSSRVKLQTCVEFILRSRIEAIQIVITDSGLTEILSHIFAAFDLTLKEVDLSQNSIVSISENAFQNLSLLQYINLSGNKLKEIPGKAFNNLATLGELNLSHNDITVIQDDGFVYLPKLSVLLLDRNHLSHIPFKTLEPMRISYLNLSDNNISTVMNTIMNMQYLEHLFINNNHLTTLPSEMSRLFNRSEFIMKFGRNPWHCNCSLLWMIKLVQAGYSNDTVVCDQPAFINMLEFNVTQIRCDVTDTKIRGVSFGIIGGLVALAIFGTVCASVACVFRFLSTKRTRRRRSLKMIINGNYHRPGSVADTSALSMSTNHIDSGLAAWKDNIHDVGFTDTNTNGKLRLGKLIGRGAFGNVYEGLASGIDNKWKKVAVKKLRDNYSPEESSILAREFRQLTEIGKHPNIIHVYGSGVINGSFIMVMELAEYGDLLCHLKDIERLESKVINNLDNSEEKFYLPAKHPNLFIFMWNIAKGMEFLSRLKVVHRDLAARNILLSEGTTAKISDFGLSRDMYESGYYYQDSKGRLPYKWMSPETLSGGKYTTKSDVWSFGVLLWEVATLGSPPYPGIPPDMLLDMYKARYIMPQPPLCPDSLYAIMEHCWNYDVNQRPEFGVLLEALDKVVQTCTNQEYLDLVMNDTMVELDDGFQHIKH